MSPGNKQVKLEQVAEATAQLLWQHGIEGVTHAR